MKLFIYDKKTRKLKSCAVCGGMLYTLKDPPRLVRRCSMLLAPAAIITLPIVAGLIPLYVSVVPAVLVALAIAVLLSYVMSFHWRDVEWSVDIDKLVPRECAAKLSNTTFVAFDSDMLVVIYSQHHPVLSSDDKFAKLFDCRSFVNEFEAVVGGSVSIEYTTTDNQHRANQEADQVRIIIERHFGAK